MFSIHHKISSSKRFKKRIVLLEGFSKSAGKSLTRLEDAQPTQSQTSRGRFNDFTDAKPKTWQKDCRQKQSGTEVGPYLRARKSESTRKS